jgi:hypothetical protein
LAEVEEDCIRQISAAHCWWPRWVLKNKSFMEIMTSCIILHNIIIEDKCDMAGKNFR